MTEERNEKIDALLPPPELLERYKELGLGNNLIELVKDEQKHRHHLQNKYALNYRMGQMSSFIIAIYFFTRTFDLIKNGFANQAYILCGIFSILVLLVVIIVRRKKELIAKKRFSRTNNTRPVNSRYNNTRSYNNNYNYNRR